MGDDGEQRASVHIRGETLNVSLRILLAAAHVKRIWNVPI